MRKTGSLLLISNNLLQSNFSIVFPKDLADEIRPKLSDKEYSEKQFFEEYGEIISLLHEQDVRIKLQKHNNKIGFFVILVVLCILVAILVEIGAVLSF